MGCKAENFPAVLRSVFALENIRGALVTMPHKVSVVDLCDEVTPVVKVAGSCNAVKRLPDGRLLGDMFDGEGFVRGLPAPRACSCARPGAGGGRWRRRLGIAASLAGAGIAALAVYDVQAEVAEAAGRPPAHALSGGDGGHRKQGPRGLRPGRQCDAAGHEPGRSAAGGHGPAGPRTFVGEVVMKTR
jgi:shikimate dehydrogenase